MARLCSQLTVDDWEWVIWSYKTIAHPSPQPSTLEVETHQIRVGTNIYGDYSEKMAQMDQEDGFMSWGGRGNLDGPNLLFGIVYHVIYHVSIKSQDFLSHYDPAHKKNERKLKLHGRDLPYTILLILVLSTLCTCALNPLYLIWYFIWWPKPLC
ncbi:hypothetical protein BKA82DRAFT_4018731 [Pisolithus tinctorius]|nr:hypothetical protein BKA82DRAFT_4018731 [Pisolithus tinctorius]